MPPIQYWFTGSAVAAFIALIAVGGCWYLAAVSELQLSNNKVQSADRQARTALVKDLLGNAIAAGNDLAHDLSNQPDQFVAERAVVAWTDQTRGLIDAAYGNGEAALFMDSSGYSFNSDGTTRTSLGNFVDGRMRRLSELLQRSDNMTVRAEFKPDRFHQSKP